jgi:hypothetical protein
MFKEAHENEKCGVVPKLQANKKKLMVNIFVPGLYLFASGHGKQAQQLATDKRMNITE